MHDLESALDAAWETIATSDDPVLIKRARDKDQDQDKHGGGKEAAAKAG